MNFKADSPLINKIKMLGNGQGYFSQAFFVDALIPLFRNDAFRFVYTDFEENGKLYPNITTFLKLYFDTVFKIYKDCLPQENETKYSSILLKTTGMGALIKLLPQVFNSIKRENNIIDSKDVLLLESPKIIQCIENFFKEIKNNGDKYFSSNSQFSKGAGKGLQSKLFEEIKKDLGISKNSKRDDLPAI